MRHMVKPGETLYSIGWRYGMDYHDIADWNDLASPYRLKEGQMLRLAPETKPWWMEYENPQTASVQPADITSPRPPKTTTRPPGANTKKIPPRFSVPDDKENTLTWQWPSQGELIATFEPDGRGNKGINISGNRGQAILAASAGEVVYSGSGLVGLGKLIIIKHNRTYLSAYAHNDDLLVKEGTKVLQGQQIATMGSSGIERVMLHFEIRKNGKPVDPLQYIKGTTTVSGGGNGT
jgi:lipoprotein NlpD